MLLSRSYRLFALTAAIFGLIAVCTVTSYAQTAQVQIIHGSSDRALRWIDFYVDGQLVKDSLRFRTATEYLEVPSGAAVVAGLAPPNSSGPQDIFETVPLALEEGGQYVLVVMGVLDPISYKRNPDGIATSVTVLAVESKNEADVDSTSDYLFVNGVTDAPAVAFSPDDGAPIATDVEYASASSYAAFDEFTYTLRVAPGAALPRIIAQYDLDVGFLQNEAFTVVLTGFVSKFENPSGPEIDLKLLIVRNDGFFRELKPIPTPETFATMQVINNSSDVTQPNGFDILLDGGRAVDNLRRRGATPAFAVPAGLNLSIQVADSSSTDVFASTIISTEPGINYLVMVNGLVNPNIFAPNPDGRSTRLSIVTNPNIRRAPADLGVGEFIFSNGITDAPQVDLEVTSIETVTGVPYGEMTGYLTLTMFEPLIELFRTSSPLPPLARHLMDLNQFGFTLGKSFVIFATGFENPDRNRDGIGVELFFALQDGFVGSLKFREQELAFSRLQLIHAAADPSLQTVDMYIDTFRVSNDAPFRSATGFFDVFSGKTVTVGVAPASSTGFRDIVVSRRFIFDPQSTSTAIARGVFDPGSFAPNPDGIDIGADFHLIEGSLAQGPDASQVTLLVANEVTDMQTVDIILDDAVPYATNTAFSQASAYGLVSPSRHAFDFRDANAGNRVVKSFVELFALQGRAGILVASGFVDSSAVNLEGPAFRTFLVLDDGTTMMFDEIFTSVEGQPSELPSELAIRSVYPNPFRNEATLVFDLPEPGTVTVELFDMTGRRLASVEPRLLQAGKERSLSLRVKDLPSGAYLYRLTTATSSGSQAVHGELLHIR
jgi:hypothetical protein